MSATCSLRLEALGAGEARMTYALALLSHPGLTLSQWQRRLRPQKGAAEMPVIGVFNENNCAIAVLRRSRRGITVLAPPPAFTVELPRLLEWIENAWPSLPQSQRERRSG